MTAATSYADDLVEVEVDREEPDTETEHRTFDPGQAELARIRIEQAIRRYQIRIGAPVTTDATPQKVVRL